MSKVSKLLDGIRAAAVSIRLEPLSPGWLVWAEWAQEHVEDGASEYRRALARVLVTCRVGRFHLPYQVHDTLHLLSQQGLFPAGWDADVWVLVDEQREERQKNLVEWLEQPREQRKEAWGPATQP